MNILRLKARRLDEQILDVKPHSNFAQDAGHTKWHRKMGGDRHHPMTMHSFGSGQILSSLSVLRTVVHVYVHVGYVKKVHFGPQFPLLRM